MGSTDLYDNSTNSTLSQLSRIRVPNGFVFNLSIPYSRAMALGLNQHLTELVPENVSEEQSAVGV
jgi:hypothetical protein